MKTDDGKLEINGIERTDQPDQWKATARDAENFSYELVINSDNPEAVEPHAKAQEIGQWTRL